MQEHIATVKRFEESVDGNAGHSQEAYQTAITAVRAALRNGRSTGCRVLDDSFALRRAHIFSFAEVVRMTEAELAANIGKPVAVMYSDCASVVVGTIASPRLIVDRQGQVMMVPTSEYERFDRVTERCVVHRGAIPLGSLATYSSPTMFRERVRVMYQILSIQAKLIERAEEVRTCGLVNVVRIGTSELDKRVPDRDFVDDSFLRAHEAWKRECMMVLAGEGVILNKHMKAWV